jgi:hypothetical protein
MNSEWVNLACIVLLAAAAVKGALLLLEILTR